MKLMMSIKMFEQIMHDIDSHNDGGDDKRDMAPHYSYG